MCDDSELITIPFERSSFARFSKTNLSLVTKLEGSCDYMGEEMKTMITKDAASDRLLEALTIDSGLVQQLRYIQCILTRDPDDHDYFTSFKNLGLLDYWTNGRQLIAMTTSL